MTVFVQRDDEGNICGIFLLKQEGYAEEELPADDPAVVAYLAENTP